MTLTCIHATIYQGTAYSPGQTLEIVDAAAAERLIIGGRWSRPVNPPTAGPGDHFSASNYVAWQTLSGSPLTFPVAPNAGGSPNATVTLAADAALATPAAHVGQAGTIHVVQNGTGGWAISPAVAGDWLRVGSEAWSATAVAANKRVDIVWQALPGGKFSYRIQKYA